MLTCAIIDDDEINRLTLEHYVELTPDLKLVASLADGIAGLTFFREGGKVDVLFLDIEMPHLSGLELLRVLTDPPEVIITTARQDFAVDAFELRVTDYLVKPFEFARFTQAVQRVQARRSGPAAPAAAPEAPSNTDLFVKVNSRMVRINFDEVLYVEALSDYVNIVTAKHKYIVYTTLKALETRLSSFPNFIRVHRSYLLNTQQIESIEDNTANLRGGHFVPIGKSYQEAFYKGLQRI
ncbi:MULTISPECIES: LytR/AlgR family response regulator transcription factor [Hymenobacter]|uniref:Response regulator transcription factor n=1 Tax=Hymenobacter armeniacus TaxID=2771358 RepID=A0ABR8JXD2_9BACT|nr:MULTISPECIES: LytTR family DNA-binding domain-containing protein [Hymenobacter]MBD2723453.1 response regulator transcription factor [Hymenobacter armeniacus]MBJ6107462.1 response regulator transcription factor [Hymenobacter sp. BT523]